MSSAPAPSATTSATTDPDPRRWRILTVCLGAGFLTLLDVSIVNVALPSIRTSLDAGPGAVQWIVAGYTLAFGLSLIPAGRLGDARGRRTLFLVGLIGFVVTSAAAGAAPDDTTLVILRLIQGAFAGMLNPQVIGLIQQLFSGAERGRAFGLFGASIGISTAVGPLLGGLLIQVFGTEHGWRWVFWVNVPVGLVLGVAAWRLLPRGGRVSGRLSLDPVGLGLIGVATVATMLPFVMTTGGGDDDPRRWAILAVAVAAGLVFWRWERAYGRSGKHPVLDVALLGHPPFRYGCLLGMTYFGGFTSIFLVTTLYLQSGLGFTALQAGAVGVPFALASAVTSWLAGRWVSSGGRWVVVAGLVLVLVGLALTDVVARSSSGVTAGLLVAATQMIAGAGSGLVISPNQTLTLADVPLGSAGVAGSVLQVGQRIGSTVGVAAVTSVFFLGLGGDGGMPGEEQYGAALSRGLAVSIALVALALVFALIDARRRVRHHEPATGSAASVTG